MHCPYCGKEMEAGHIRSSHAIYWGKERDTWSVADEIRLNKFSLKGMFDGCAVEAHRCSSCKKLIVALEEAEE